MRAITDEAVAASKAARRSRERRLRLIQGGRVDPMPGIPEPEGPTVAEEEADQSKVQPWERMLPFEEWT